MIEKRKECPSDSELFYSFEAKNIRSEIYIQKDLINGEYTPSACFKLEGVNGKWLQPTKITIEEWAKYFVQIMGYKDAENLDSNDITYSLDMEKKEIQFNGPFGYLIIESVGHFLCDFNPEP